MTRLGFTLAALLAAGSAVAAPPAGRRAAQVGSAPVSARSGPSDKFPDTGVLPAGARVVVVSEEPGGWVGIDAAGLNQRSWVRYAHVFDPDHPPGEFPWNAVVDPDGSADVDIAAGLVGTNKPLDVRRLTVPRGTVLKLLGPHVEHGGVKWFPVEPPAGERRYVPASAVEWRDAAVPTVTVKSPPTAPPAPGVPAGEAPAPAPMTTPAAHPPGDPSDHRQWAEAERAASAREFRRAEELYVNIAADMNLQNRRDAANLCLKRVQELRADARAGGPASDSTARWHGPGKLRLAGVKYEGRATYAVSNPDGKGTACYVVADPGVDLDRFRDYTVDLYGRSITPAELNGVPLVTATRVQQAQR